MTLSFTSVGTGINMDNVRLNEAAPVPIPPSALLLGSGILGMGLMGWRRRSITA